MKRVTFLFALTALMVFSPGVVHGATEIVLNGGVPATGHLGGDTVGASSSVKFEFRLTYTPGDGSSILASTNGFRVWTYANGVNNYTDNFSAITYDTFPWEWSAFYDYIVIIDTFGVDGLGADTVGFAGVRLFGAGIAGGTDSLCWWVETTPTTHGDTLCIDSSLYPPIGDWVWSTNGPLGCMIPSWGGPYCWHVQGAVSCCNHDGIRGDCNYDMSLNVADLTYLVDYLFFGGDTPPCPEEGNVDANGGINVADLTYLVEYLFFQGPAPPSCP